MFAAAKRFKDAGRCQAELKENLAKLAQFEHQVKKTEETKLQITTDMNEKKNELSKLDESMRELDSKVTSNHIRTVLYRKQELIDLVKAISNKPDDGELA